MVEESTTSPDVDYLRLLRRIANRWRLIALISLAIVLPVTAYAVVFVPKMYEAVAKIFFEDPRRLQAGMMRDWMPASDASFQLAILKSRSLAEAVVENLPRETAEELLARGMHRDYLLEGRNLFRRVMGQDSIIYSPQQRAVTELQSARVTFTPLPSGEVEIRAVAYAPRVAMDLANTYVEVLQTREGRPHVMIHPDDAAALDAKSYSLKGFDTPKASYNLPRFGAFIGGPLNIPKIFNGGNKWFFFAGWNGSRGSTPYDYFSTVPTLAERGGDFSAATYNNGRPVQISEIAELADRLHQPVSRALDYLTGASAGVPWSQNSTMPTYPSTSYTGWQQYQLYAGGFTYTAATVNSSLVNTNLLVTKVVTPVAGDPIPES